MSAPGSSEGLKFARLIMVLSSVSPLFILWGIRGTCLIPDRFFLGFCAVMIIVPNAFLLLRIATARRNKELRELVVGASEGPSRPPPRLPLFSMLLPFYADNLLTWRALTAAFAALGFIIFLFWHLNLHYMNVLFAACGYRVFTLYSLVDGNPLTGRGSQVLITRRAFVAAGDRVAAYRISDTVYFEGDE